jgi:short-subunit dehydrogenase
LLITGYLDGTDVVRGQDAINEGHRRMDPTAFPATGRTQMSDTTPDLPSTDPQVRRPLAVVTGASSGIGLELARQFADHGFDLLITAEDAELAAAAEQLKTPDAQVQVVSADLRTFEGVEDLWAAIEAAAPIDAIALNAGVGVSAPFAEADLRSQLDLVQLNVTSQVHLARRVLPGMLQRKSGRVLVTSSIAATQPGPFEAVYGASKAFLFSFAESLRAEVKDEGVTVTALMPGPTQTEFFDRAQMRDTKLGAGPKDDAAQVARQGFEALMSGKDHVVAGSVKNKVMAGVAKVVPEKVKAVAHRTLSAPGSADEQTDRSPEN